MHGLVAPLPRDHEQLIADDLSYRTPSSRGKGLTIRPPERLRNEGDDVEAAASYLAASEFLMNRLD